MAAKTKEPNFKPRVLGVSVPLHRVIKIGDKSVMHMKMHIGEGTFTDGTKFQVGHILPGGMSCLVETPDGLVEYTIELLDFCEAVERAHSEKLAHEEA